MRICSSENQPLYKKFEVGPVIASPPTGDAMVGTKGCSGGWRPGAGRKPDATTIKKKSKIKSKKPNQKQSNKPNEQPKLAASATFFESWHKKMMAQTAVDKAEQLAAAAARKAASSC
jgi:hypothetical protein